MTAAARLRVGSAQTASRGTSFVVHERHGRPDFSRAAAGLGVARQVLRSVPMEPIDPQALTAVRGGFGALLTALPGILSGVTGLIGMLKGGGGTATSSAQQPQATMATPPGPAGATATAPQTQTATTDPTGGAGACRSCCDPIGASSVTNIIRIG